MSYDTEPEVTTEPEAMTTDEAVQAALAYDAQLRLWLRALSPLIGSRLDDDDPNPRVQLALDWMRVAAAEAVGRICARVSPSERLD
jgi:hypothetical protein